MVKGRGDIVCVSEEVDIENLAGEGDGSEGVAIRKLEELQHVPERRRAEGVKQV